MNTHYELLVKNPKAVVIACLLLSISAVASLAGIALAICAEQLPTMIVAALVAMAAGVIGLHHARQINDPDYLAIERFEPGSLQTPRMLRVDELTATIDGVVDVSADRQMADGQLVLKGYDHLGGFSTQEQLQALITENEN